MKLVDYLRDELEGDVVGDPSVLAEHATDASLFEVQPSLVVFPKHTRDVTKLVNRVTHARAAGEATSLTARAAGTDMTGGPLTFSVVVNFTKYFNHLLTIKGHHAVVEPGVYYRDFEAALADHDLFLPSYPASKDLCTVGGMVANNAGGEKTLTYGKTADYVEEVEMVLRNGMAYSFRKLTLEKLAAKQKLTTLEGDIYRRLYQLVTAHKELIYAARPRVSKNSAGYALWDVLDEEQKTFDITRILTGSQGTLGLLTKIKFRLMQPRPHSRLLVISLYDIAQLGEIVNHVLEFLPESFESYDDHTFKVALRLLPALARRLKGNILTTAWQFLPDFWLLLRGGIPKLVLLAEFTGETEKEAAAQAELAEARLKAYGVRTKVTKSPAEGEKYWAMRRESFTLLRQSVQGLHTAPFIDDFVVAPEKLPEFLPRLYAILDQHDIIYTVAGHIGDGNFHIIPLMNLHDKKTKEILTDLSEKVYPLVISYGGSISGEHNDGLVRSPYLKEQFGEEVYRLFEEVKRIFDPDNMFNPGKKVGSSWKYALEHLATGPDTRVDK